MPHRLFSKFFTFVVALSFVAISVVAPVGVRTANAEDISYTELTSGMSAWEDLAGIAATCAASSFVTSTLVPGISTATSYIGDAFSYFNLASAANIPATAEKTAATVALTSAETTLPIAAGTLGGAAGGVTLGGGGISAAASVPAADWTQIAQRSAQMTAQGELMLHTALMDTLKVTEIQAKIPKEAEAKATTGVFDCIVYNAGQMMLNQLTNNLVSWIQGGFDGSPSFTLNTHEIFLQLADMVAGDLAREIRGIAMCSFSANFKNDLANQVELSAKYDYKFDDKTKCPFPETFNINSSDFYQGVNTFSWGAMEYALQDPGNPFGVQMLTNDELARRTSEKKEVRKQELGWSNGFTAMVDTNNCNYPDKVAEHMAETQSQDAAYETVTQINPVTGALESETILMSPATEGISQAELAEYQKTYCKTTTPGKIVGDSLTKATGIDMDRLGMIDNINKIIGALIEQVTKKAAEGIFCFAANASQSEAGCDNEIKTDYVYIADKTAETVAMENAAIGQCYDAWQNEIKKKSLAEEKLASLNEDLLAVNVNLSVTEQTSSANELDNLMAEIAEQQAIIDAAGDDMTGKIGNAKINYDYITSADASVARAAELEAANAEVDSAKAAQDTAEANATNARNTYYDYLAGSLSGGQYISPDPGQLAAYKAAMDAANEVLEDAQKTYQEATNRLNVAQNPESGC